MRQRIFVGDVQGCADELVLLVDRAKARFGDAFELWVAGDVVNRGPDNRRALELVRGLLESGRGRYVLGNHEIHLLLVAFGLRDLARNDSIGDVLGAPDATEWVDWLRSRALVEPGVIAGQPFAMVHAASHPDWSLERLCEVGSAVQARLAGERDAARAFLALPADADPLRDALGRMTRCRSVASDGRWSSADPAPPMRPWHAAWAERSHGFGLVYGHWARQGLHAAPGLRGLDTGCVHHGRGRDGFLTAWVPDESPAADGRRSFDVPDDRFWHIPARRRYYFPEAGGLDD
ncbi:MAG: metallophosphoesterase [Deltaproteobacteria bacterium]|nr:metallophosphoesterase [Deltaproteobacteria bacterium]